MVHYITPTGSCRRNDEPAACEVLDRYRRWCRLQRPRGCATPVYQKALRSFFWNGASFDPSFLDVNAVDASLDCRKRNQGWHKRDNLSARGACGNDKKGSRFQPIQRRFSWALDSRARRKSSALLNPKGLHGLQRGGTIGWNDRRHTRACSERNHGRRKSHRIPASNSIELRCNQASGTDG